MRQIFSVLALLALGACAGNPPVRQLPLRTASENAHRSALAATQAQRWDDAARSWREALIGYQAIDDWNGQGLARLGLAHVLDWQGRKDLAGATLTDMPEQSLFPASLRAQASFRLAQLRLPDKPELSRQLLDRAIVLCGNRCSLQAQFDNFAARLAAARGDWSIVIRHADAALSSAQDNPAERAHARRLLAEAALAQGRAVDARQLIGLVLNDDRQLADPHWLALDYALQAKVAEALNDDSLLLEAETRHGILCEAARLTDCPSLMRQKP